MKIDQFQLAFYAHNEAQVQEIKARLGLLGSEWVEDIATGMVSVRGEPEEVSKAHLRFCYAYPLEIEILTYLQGPHWHQNKPEFLAGESFVSHIGLHMAEEELAPYVDKVAAQIMDTTDHTNPYLIEQGRKYHYEIYDRHENGVANVLGADLKYIWRV